MERKDCCRILDRLDKRIEILKEHPFISKVISDTSNISMLSIGKKDSETSTIDTNLNWAGSLINKYIQYANNKLINLQKPSIDTIWTIMAAYRKGIKYIVARIGHNFEHRFITAAWIYIDPYTSNI